MTGAGAASAQPPQAGQGVERPRSARVRLARVARDAALGVRGIAVVGPDMRPDRATFDAGEMLRGVVCAADSGGRYGVALYVGAEPLPLYALADAVRGAVATAAERNDLAAELGRIDIMIDDLVEPETAR